MRERLNKPHFLQRCLQTFFIFLSRALADFFEKNGKKNKTTSVYRRVLRWTAKAFLYGYTAVHSLFCIDYESTDAVNLLTSCGTHAFAQFVLQRVELRLSNSLFREDNEVTKAAENHSTFPNRWIICWDSHNETVHIVFTEFYDNGNER